MFPEFNAPTYAGFWWRVLAYIIDSLIMSAVFVPLGIVLGVVMIASGTDENSPVMPLVNLGVNGLSILGSWLYHSLLESSSWQGTVGKKVCGLRVTDLDGHRISFARATGRYFGMILSGMICLIGFVMVAFTEKKQGLHDILAGTLVWKGEAPTSYPVPPPPPDFGYRAGNWA
jgi:uncharacterized RDD family membrane protein YckC